MERIKEEKSLLVRKHSFAQKEIKAVLKELVKAVGVQTGTVFSKEEQKSPSKLTIPMPDVRYQERDFWAKADEKMAKVKSLCERKNLFKSSLERSEVPTQI